MTPIQAYNYMLKNDVGSIIYTNSKDQLVIQHIKTTPQYAINDINAICIL